LELLITVKNYALVVFGLGVAIFVHEFGHFIVAKLAGVKVERFSIGFGKPLFKWVRGETEYVLAAIPLGGFVQMLGQSDFGSTEKTDDPRSYARKTPGARALIIVAGVTMNALLAVVLFSLVFTVGKPAISPEVGAVVPGSPADRAGIKAGEMIIGVNGYRFIDFEDVKIQVVLAGTKKPVRLEVASDGRVREVTVTPEMPEGAVMPTIGIIHAIGLKVWQVDKEAKRRGVAIRRGDVIEAINGEPVRDWSDLVREMAEGKARKITLTVRRDGKTLDVDYRPRAIDNWRFGITSAGPFTIAYVSKGMPAEAAGLRKGDTVVSMNGRVIRSFTQLQALIDEAKGKPIHVVYSRDGERRETDVTPVYVPYYDPSDISPVRWRIGVAPHFPLEVGEVTAGSGAEKAGIKPGAKILKFEYFKANAARPKRSWTAAEMKNMVLLQARVRAIRANDEDARFKLYWELDGERHSAFVEPEKTGDPVGRFEFVTNNKMIKLQTDPLHAVGFGLRKTWFFIRMSFTTISRLISRKMKVNDGAVSGPVGIFYYGSKVANEGLRHLTYLFAIINISLAFFNLLPVAPLDGGHLVFLGIEKIRGKPVSEKLVYAVFITGWVLLLGFVLYVTFFDILKFLR